MDRRRVLKNLSILLGGTVSSACQHALQAVSAERVEVVAAYDAAQGAIAHRVMDLIIPTTDTPGAQAAGVSDFLDYVVAQWYQASERQSFLAGLLKLDADAMQKYGHNFLALAEAQQIVLLNSLDEASQMRATSDLDIVQQQDFFAQIKELTVVGYYTSEIGATQELSYVPMPGRYDGYYQFTDVGRQWSK